MRIKFKDFTGLIESFFRNDASTPRVYQFPNRDITVAGTDELDAKLTITKFKVTVPSGTVNGSNAVFTFSDTPLDGTLVLFSDTSALIEGVDYTRVGAVVTLGIAPITSIFGLYLTA